MRALIWPLMVIMILGCSGTRTGSEQKTGETKVKVENQDMLDMSVYLLRDSQRHRLGLVPGLSTRVFVIPEHMIFGVATIRLLADPIGGRGTPVSNEFTVLPGDEIEMVIMKQ